jgi:glycine reductase
VRLELHKISITGLELGSVTALKGGVLTVDEKTVLEMLRTDSRFAEVAVDVARPGERTRITPVKDVVQPRCKLEGPGEVFPGFIGDVETVGSGKTLVLGGAAVVTCGQIVGFQEGIVDMSGPGAAYTPFSGTFNLVLVSLPWRGWKNTTTKAPVARQDSGSPIILPRR